MAHLHFLIPNLNNPSPVLQLFNFKDYTGHNSRLLTIQSYNISPWA